MSRTGNPSLRPANALTRLWIRARSEIIYNRLMATLNRADFYEVKRHCLSAEGRQRDRSQSPLKYLDSGKFIRKNVRLALRLGIDQLPRSSVLDIGSGAGYFLLVCRYFGHDPLELDQDTEMV